jgi:hypothetical protein
VRVNHVRAGGDPYNHAAELRAHRSMTLTTIASEAPHPHPGGEERTRAHRQERDAVRDVKRWICSLTCCYDLHRERREPGLRADLPPAELLAACDQSPAC